MSLIYESEIHFFLSKIIHVLTMTELLKFEYENNLSLKVDC